MPNTEITSTVNVGLIQRKNLASSENNLKETIENINQAAEAGANIVCLQELYKTSYFCQSEETKNFALAETIPGPSTQAFSAIAREKEIVIIAPLFEKRSAGVYHNTAVVIDADGTFAGRYRKMHIPDDPCFYEKFYFTPGDLGFQVFNTKYGNLGVLICWDQWFPEAARLTTLLGANILFYPTAIGFQEEDRPVADKQTQAWQTIQRSHAIANGVFVASTNRVGKEDKITFWGQSFICDPFGEILASASKNDAEVLIATCDLNEIENTRQGWPFLRDRRVDSYSGLNQILLDTP